MDEIREYLRVALDRAGKSDAWLSHALGKNDAYINQFFTGKQKRLPYEVRAAIVGLLDVDPRLMDVTPRSATPAQSSPAGGFSDDAEAWQPPRDHYLAAGPHIGFFRMRSAALDQHPERIRAGHLLAFNLNKVARESIHPGAIVLAQLVDRAEFLKGHGTIIRQFVPPNKLITNSSGVNEIISMDDEGLPYEVVIRGVLLSVVREIT